MLNDFLLYKKIYAKNLSGSAVARQLGISRTSFQNKMTHKTAFTLREVTGLIKILNLTPEETMRIFLNDRNNQV